MTPSARKMKLMELDLQISKSETAKKDLAYQIARAEADIERMMEHQKLQDVAIEAAKAEVEKLNKEVSNG